MILFQRAVSAALLITALLAACSSKEPSAESSPSVVITAVSETADSFHITPPEGWVVVPVKSYEAMDYIASANGDPGFSAASLRVQHWSLEALRVTLGRGEEKPVIIDVNGYRDEGMESARMVERISDVAALPDRMITGEHAVGYSRIVTDDGVPERYDTWLVGRHDGLWRFTLNSAPGESVVPSEARAALDTVAWGPPGSATPTVRES